MKKEKLQRAILTAFWSEHKRQPTDAELSQRILVLENKGLIFSTIRKGYLHNRYQHEDATSSGFIGLTEAAARYDVSRGTAFSTLAIPYIRGRILHDSFKSRLTNIDRSLLEAISRARKGFRSIHGRESTNDELLASLPDRNSKLVLAAVRALWTPDTLDRPINNDYVDATTLGESLEDSCEGIEARMIRVQSINWLKNHLLQGVLDSWAAHLSATHAVVPMECKRCRKILLALHHGIVGEDKGLTYTEISRRFPRFYNRNLVSRMVKMEMVALNSAARREHAVH